MAIRRSERSGEFRARDGYGKWYTIVVFQQIIDAIRAHGKDERVAVKAFYEGGEYLYRLVKRRSGGK